MVQKVYLHGFGISYEDNARDGIEYLRDDLDVSEARVFFEYARRNGSAQFEDDDDRQFTLVYEDGNYVLIRR